MSRFVVLTAITPFIVAFLSPDSIATMRWGGAFPVVLDAVLGWASRNRSVSPLFVSPHVKEWNFVECGGVGEPVVLSIEGLHLIFRAPSAWNYSHFAVTYSVDMGDGSPLLQGHDILLPQEPEETYWYEKSFSHIYQDIGVYRIDYSYHVESSSAHVWDNNTRSKVFQQMEYGCLLGSDSPTASPSLSTSQSLDIHVLTGLAVVLLGALSCL